MRIEQLVALIVVAVLLVFLVAPVWCLILLYQIRRRQTRQDEQLERLDHALRRQEVGRRPEMEPAMPGTTTAGVTPARAATAPLPAPPVPVAAPPILVARQPQATAPARAPASGPVPCAETPVPPTPPAPPPRAASEFESKARTALLKVWNWLIVGEEHRARGVSMEFAFASNWLLRLGVLAVVVGIGFFIKYQIDRDLLGPQARVGLSIVAGVVMLAGGLRLLGKQYHLMGQGLIGMGLATLYFSVFASVALFHLVDVIPGFVLMALITCGAGVMAVRLNSMLIAILGILGGYGTPIMLSTGTANFPGLYSYLLLLGAGILGIACQKHWPLLNYLGMIGTYGLGLAAIDKFYTTADFPVVMPFLAAFFVLYSTVIFIFQVANRERASLLELLGLFANAGVFFAAGYHLIDGVYGRAWVAALTLAMALFYVLHIYVFLERRLQDRGLLLGFTALAAFFLTVTLPLILSPAWITASWAVQALIMLWISGKLDSQFLRLLSYAVYLLVLYRFCALDLHRQFAAGPPAGLPWTDYLPLVGERLAMFGVPIGAIAGAWKLLRQPGAKASLALDRANDVRAWVGERWMAQAFVGLSVLMLFVYLQMELDRTCGFLFPPWRLTSLTLVWVGLGAGVLTLCRTAKGLALPALLAAVVAGLLVKLVVFDLAAWNPVYENMCYGGAYSGLDALVRFADLGMIIAFLGVAHSTLRGRDSARAVAVMAAGACLVLLFVYLTLELNTALAHYKPGFRAGAVSILWSLFALALVFAGIRKAARALRYPGLLLFGVGVGKIFFSDLASLDPTYRIAAFIVLGLVLLTGSFVYLKYRQRFQVDPSAPAGTRPPSP